MCRAECETVTIQPGDTFDKIADNWIGVTVDDMLAANPSVAPTKLQVGQVVNLRPC